MSSLGTCEIVHASPGSSGANPTRRFLRGVASVAFGYTASEDVTPDIQYVGIADPSFCVYDFGDAPDTYGTNVNTTAARHVLGQRNVYLGASPPDGELSGRANATATGDNATAPLLLADEDGVATFPAYTPGSTTYTVSVNATNTSGSAAFLYGYIDWNRDGDFVDANERVAGGQVANGSLTAGEAPGDELQRDLDLGARELPAARQRLSPASASRRTRRRSSHPPASRRTARSRTTRSRPGRCR